MTYEQVFTQSFTYWMSRFTQWAIASADPQTNASIDAQQKIAEQQVLEMAQANVDMLLRNGYAPHQVAIALARAACLTVTEMIVRYVPEARPPS